MQCQDAEALGRDVKADDLRQMFLAMTEEVGDFCPCIRLLVSSDANVFVTTEQLEIAALSLKAFLLPSSCRNRSTISSRIAGTGDHCKTCRSASQYEDFDAHALS